MSESLIREMGQMARELHETYQQYLLACERIDQLEAEKEQLLRELAQADSIVERAAQPWLHQEILA